MGYEFLYFENSLPNLYVSLLLNENNSVFYHKEYDVDVMSINDTVIDQIKYQEVIVLHSDTTDLNNDNGFWKLIIAKDIGIVKIYEKGSGTVWSIIER